MTAQRSFREASVSPSTVDADKRTIEVTWTTGAKVTRYSWVHGEVVEELVVSPEAVRMGRLTSGAAPVLADHRASIANTVGVVESARLEGGVGVARLRFASDPDSDKVFRKVAEGVLRNISVGYEIHAIQRDAKGDLPKDSAGRTLMTVSDWEPYELSIVAIPADAGATTRDLPGTEEKQMPANETAPEPIDVEKAQRKAVEAERDRVTKITSMAREFKRESMADKLITDGVTVDAARIAVLEAVAADAIRAQPVQAAPAPSVEVVSTHEDKQRVAQVAELLDRSGDLDLVRRASAKQGLPSRLAKDLEVGEPGHALRGMTLMDMAKASLERSGVRTAGMSRREIARRALQVRGGYSASGDFPVLLEDAARKTLLAAYATQSDTWRAFVGTTTVGAFRSESRYRAGSFGDVLLTVEEGAEYKQVAIPDGAKISVETQKSGRIIAFTMEMLDRDDLGAFTALAAAFGRSAGLSMENAAYALLTANAGLGPTVAGTPFFDASRSNIGTGGALSVASLDVDRVVLASQLDVSGNEYLDLRPSTLVVPLGLESSAKLINAATFDPTSGAATQRPNTAAGMFRTIVGSPRLTGTRRYMFADPAVYPAFVAVFHSEYGQGPTIETEDSFDTDATRMKVGLVVKFQAFDVKTAVTNAGV